MKYCVRVQREVDEDCIFHYDFKEKPTRDQVLKKVMEEDCGYDDNYGKIEFWEV